MAPYLGPVIKHFELTTVDNQFLQKRRDVHDSAYSRQSAHKFRSKVQRTQRDFASHPNSVRNPSRYPESARRGKYPHALRGFYRHYALTGINDLIAIVIVLIEYKTVWIVMAKRSDERT